MLETTLSAVSTAANATICKCIKLRLSREGWMVWDGRRGSKKVGVRLGKAANSYTEIGCCSLVPRQTWCNTQHEVTDLATKVIMKESTIFLPWRTLTGKKRYKTVLLKHLHHLLVRRSLLKHLHRKVLFTTVWSVKTDSEDQMFLLTTFLYFPYSEGFLIMTCISMNFKSKSTSDTSQ